ncbi:glyoxalase superfamily protein [Roseobacteraceae bacterium NS-SX3]
MNLQTLAEAKALAKSLRQALAEAGTAISHSQALEMVARQNGARDWNTLHARLAAAAPPPLGLHSKVRGLYLGQRFTGQITALSKAGAGYAISIQLDQPVDTVRFESFSNMRRRIRGVVGADGRALRKTSDGMPQLIIDLPERKS